MMKYINVGYRTESNVLKDLQTIGNHIVAIMLDKEEDIERYFTQLVFLHRQNV